MKKLYSIFVLSAVSTFSVFGQGAGQTIDFTSPEQVTIPNASQLNPTTSITLEAWINADSWGPNSWNNTIIGKDSWTTVDGESGYALRCGANGTLSFNFGTNPMWREAVSPAIMSAGKWYHVAGTFDGTMIMVYINGEMVGSQPYSGTMAPNSNQLLIGNLPEPSQNRYFDGKIDEVRVWNVARTQAQIRESMCKKLAGTETGLVAYYRLDEVTGVLAADATTNANDGTTNSFVPVREFSNAPLGDDSKYLYASTWSGQTVSLSHPDGDSIIVASISGSPDFVHVYRVDETPNDSLGPIDLKELSTERYWGVYAGENSSVTYTVTYNYNGFPGITSPNSLDMAFRPDVSTSWVKASTILNIPNTTLTKSNQVEGQYILGDTVNNSPLTLYDLISPIDNATITMQGKNGSQNLIFNWNSSSLPSGGAVTYTWMLDSIGNDFSNPLMSLQSNSLGTDTTITNNYAFYRTLLLNLGVQNGQSATFKWTVEATSGSEKRRATNPHTITFNQGSFIGVEEYSLAELELFPNPASDVFTIKSEINKTLDVKIVSITGQEVYSNHLEFDGEYTIDVSHLNKGSYIVELTDAREISFYKLIIQ